MRRVSVVTALMGCVFLLTGCCLQRTDPPEPAADWVVLFDGETLEGWRGFRLEGVPQGWEIDHQERAIHFTHGEGDINLGLITEEQFDDFELRFDWMVAPGANSGVFFRVSEEYEAIWHTGPEYQVVDNVGHPDGEDPLTAAASNYALHGPDADYTNPAGEWNTARIVARGPHVEHWLNGHKVFAYELGTEDWEERVAETAFADWPSYGRVPEGHIALQESIGGPVWYRNIRLRPLE